MAKLRGVFMGAVQLGSIFHKNLLHHNTPNPTHPITIALVGCGGTGSQVLTCLARIDHCLKTLNHLGLHVCAFDPDHVSPANIGRQLFSKADTGLNKAVVLVSRINAFFGTSWDAIPEKFDKENGRSCNTIISCVDTVSSRKELGQCLHDYSKHYYLSFASKKNSF